MFFEKTEFHERLTNTKKLMLEREVDALITTNPANINYLTGYDGYSFYVIQGVIVLLDEDEPIWIGRKMDVAGAIITTWIKPEHIIGYNDEFVQSKSRHPMQVFAEVLIDRGYGNKKIGLEYGQELNVTSFMQLQSFLPNAVFQDASFLVNRVRMIKSEQEIIYMKRAGEISVNGMKTATRLIKEGVKESDVAAEIYQSLIKGTQGEYGDYPAIIPLLSSGKEVSAPHLSWTNKLYKKDNIVSIELSGCYKRYHTPLSRTVYLGSVTDTYKNIANIVLEGLNEVLLHIKAGVTCGEVANVWYRVIAKSNIVKDSRIGYPIGIGYPPDWGEQTFSIRKGDSEVLQPNMTFHILPALFQENYGFVVSESIKVTSKGCERLTDFPNELFLC